MKFSVIIGLYHQNQFLPNLIEHLNNQTFKDFEVHFCFADRKEYKEFSKFEKDCGFLYLKHRLLFNFRHSLGKNLNQGIKQARGEYAVFIMGDSFPELNYLEVLNNWAKPNRVLCGIRKHIKNDVVIDLDYRLKSKIIYPFNHEIKSPIWSTTGNGLCVPLRTLKEIGGWSQRYWGYAPEDTELALQLFLKGFQFWSIYDAILYHHQHKEQPINFKYVKYITNKIKKLCPTYK